MSSEAIDALDETLSKRESPPPSMRVGTELWKELFESGRVKHEERHLTGFPNDKFSLPFLDSTTYVECDPYLRDSQYSLSG